MKRSRFTEEQIIGVLKENEAGSSAAELCRSSSVKRLIQLINRSVQRGQRWDVL